MTTVYTKQELAKAIENRESQILCKGDIAKVFIIRKRNKKWAKILGGAMIVGGIVAMPFTGGASSAGIVAGAAGLTIGSVVISTAELVIICGTIIAVAGILKGAKVTFNKDGSVTVEPQYK